MENIMNIVKYDKYDLDELFKWDSLLERLLNDNTKNEYKPIVNVDEDDNEYVMKIDLPGFSKKNLFIKIKNGLLTIKTRKNKLNKIKNRDFMKINKSLFCKLSNSSIVAFMSSSVSVSKARRCIKVPYSAIVSSFTSFSYILPNITFQPVGLLSFMN